MEQEHRLFFTRRSENAKRGIRRLSSGYESLSKWLPFYLHAIAKYYCFYCALYNKLSYARILIGSHLWSIGGQTIDDVIIKIFLNSLLYKTNRFQVAVRLFSNRLSVTHLAAPRVPLFCSYHILTSSVIYYWTDARQLGIYLLNSRQKILWCMRLIVYYSNFYWRCFFFQPAVLKFVFIVSKWKPQFKTSGRACK